MEDTPQSSSPPRLVRRCLYIIGFTCASLLASASPALADDTLNSIFGTSADWKFLGVFAPFLKWGLGIFLVVLAVVGGWQMLIGIGQLIGKGHKNESRKSATMRMALGFLGILIAFGTVFWPIVKGFIDSYNSA